MPNFTSVRTLVVCVLAAVAASSCSKAPDLQKREYFDSANRYLEQKKYAEAIVEYKNAIQIDPAFGEAHERLSEAMIESGDVGNAARALVRAADQMPDRHDLQLKAGAVLLLARRYDEAKMRADKVLAANPKDISAQILKANALVGLKDIEHAIAEIEQAIAIDPTRADAFTARGAVQAAQGDQAAAEASFKKAIEIDPKSARAALALGNFYWAMNRGADAEQALRRALELDARQPMAHRALAVFYITTGRIAQAEPHLVALADDARDASPKLTLADYYVAQKRYDDALARLQPVVDDRVRGTSARVRIARIRYLQGNTTDAYRVVDEILEKNALSVEALLARSRFLSAEGKFTEALAVATRAAGADARSAESYYAMGVLNMQLRQIPEAQQAFGRVLELNPRAAAASLHLATMELQRGNTAASLQHARAAVSAQPENVAAQLLVAKGHLAEGNLAAAERELKTLIAAYPRWAAAHSSFGMLCLRKRDTANARKAFETALALDANALEPVSGLIAIDAQAGRLADIRARVEARVARTPDDAGVLLMAGRAYALIKDHGKAEAMFKQVIARDDTNLQAYTDLAQLYVIDRRLDEARVTFEQIAQRQPKLVGPPTMIGIILQTQNRPAEAIARYEQAIMLDRNAAVAANNLAWLYAERGEKLETALELAQNAKRVLPDRAEVSDTLGYVYLKKQAPDLAVPALRDAVKQDPENPRYRLRLGVALARSGQREESRRIVEPLLKAFPDVPEAIDARAALAESR